MTRPCDNGCREIQGVWSVDGETITLPWGHHGTIVPLLCCPKCNGTGQQPFNNTTHLGAQP